MSRDREKIIRRAEKSGSWYNLQGATALKRDLDEWLDAVPSPVTGINGTSSRLGPQEIPRDGARVIIAPHAGYAYSGPAAAWAYKALDLTKAKRVFLLGPSHRHSTDKALLSSCDEYETPLKPGLKLDKNTLRELQNQPGIGGFMSRSVDEAEHSLELHLPYIWHMLKRIHENPKDFPPLVPIMVGHTRPDTERDLGRVLAPYLADPSSVFIISSDFCHWGIGFRYTVVRDSNSRLRNLRTISKGREAYVNPGPGERKIYESIEIIDRECMDAIESGSHDAFLDKLSETGNTVCGRHPIGVIMAAIEVLEHSDKIDPARFNFIRYERSAANMGEDVEDVHDQSVSYCSAFAVLKAK